MEEKTKTTETRTHLKSLSYTQQNIYSWQTKWDWNSINLWSLRRRYYSGDTVRRSSDPYSSRTNDSIPSCTSHPWQNSYEYMCCPEGNIYQVDCIIHNQWQWPWVLRTWNARSRDRGGELLCWPLRFLAEGNHEYHNGLLRRYLPKKTSFIELTQDDLDDMVWEINNRPRKCLGFKTPQQLFHLMIQSQSLIPPIVRIQGWM